MPVVNVSFGELKEMMGKDITIEELRTMLFDFGMEVEEAQGDEVKIEITAERHDLLSAQGIARALKAYDGIAPGMPKFSAEKFDSYVESKNVAPHWPYVVCAVVKGLKLDEKKLLDIIEIQEKLGSTYLRNRRKGGMGIYPLEKITFPVTYTAKHLKEIKFVPLEWKVEMDGLEILEQHPKGIEYKDVLGLDATYPVFIDAAGKVLSMPPIINSQTMGKVTEETTDLFIELTGVDLARLQVCMNIATTALHDMGGKVYSIKIKSSVQEHVVTAPDFTPYQRKVSVSRANKMIGTFLSKPEIKICLQKMMYEVLYDEGDELVVAVPSIRTDIWHEVDIIDDIARAYGFNNITPTLLNLSTIGGTLPLSDLREKLSTLACGLEYLETYTWGLTSKEVQFEKTGYEAEHIELGSVAEKSINMLRCWLFPELLNAFEHNRSLEYPQKIYDINFVVVPDETRDVKSRNIMKMAMAHAGPEVNYTDAKQHIVYILSCLGLNVETVEIEHPTFLSGRCASVLVDGVDIGFVGEVHPRVLEKFGFKVPIAGFEVDVEKILKLLE